MHQRQRSLTRLVNVTSPGYAAIYVQIGSDIDITAEEPKAGGLKTSEHLGAVKQHHGCCP